MNDVPRQTLTHIIAKYGPAVCENPKRCEALLRDLCGEYRREVNILMGALEERVPPDLMNLGRGLPREALLARLTRRLQDHLAYTEDAARWAAETRANVAARSKKQAEEPRIVPPRAAVPPHNPAPPNNARAQSPTPAPPTALPPKQPTPSAPNRKKTLAPPTPPSGSGQQTYPSRSQGRPAPVTSPPPVSPPPPRTQPPINTNPVARQPPPFPVQLPDHQAGRRISKLRGCLLAVLLITGLIVVAVFAVPAIITLLRQEQLQPSINEPRVPRGN